MKTILQKILLLIALLMAAGSSINAEESDRVEKIKAAFDQRSQEVQKQKPSTQTEEYQSEAVTIALIENNLLYVKITAGLYAFSLIIITLLILIKRKDCQAKDLVTIIGLVSVIFGIILLVLIVDTTDTLTAPMGIFGAIAGYLFGTSQKKEGSKE